LNQFLGRLALLGGTCGIILGLGSWWLSGRSLGPAQNAWDQQQVFISNASHELRTPLTLIRASAEYGLLTHPDSEQKSLLEDILDECDHMNRLVEDLLLLSRADTHRLKLNREKIDLEDLLTEISIQVAKLAGEKKIHVALREAGGTILGDQVRVRQILLILLDNAIRFTPTGGEIGLESRQNGKTVTIQVEDSGSGIAPEHLPHVFERFYQAGGGNTDEDRNNGLGLPIAKSLVEGMGGTIRLESEEGKGTRVSIAFPAI
jgi:signal transduction histidine kinase